MPKEKKNSSVIHPNSRKALQLARQVHHNGKLQKRNEETNLKQKLKWTKLNWFKENMDASKEIYTEADVKELVDRYLKRFEVREDKEDATKSLKRHISSATFKEYKTSFLIEKENQEFEAGALEIPDLMQKKSYEIFKAWNGDVQRLPAIKTVHVSRKQFGKPKKETKISEEKVKKTETEEKVEKTETEEKCPEDDVDVYI